jgi:NADH-dependent fumarate reductase subunit C
MTPPSIPLTRKPFEEQVVSQCAGCGCGCGYVLYKAQGKPVDLYGHPADPKGMGSLCSKGITLLQEVAQNSLRLLGFYLWQGQELLNISQEQAKELIKERLKGKVAIVLDRHLSSLEEYLLAKQLGDVFVDAPVLGYKPSEVFFNQWQNYMLIIGWEAEPVFSEVMSMRYLVDAVERSAHLVCVSSRYATLCAKAKRQALLNPIKQLSFMNSLLEPEHTDPLVVELKRAMHLVKTLLLVGTDLLASSFRNQVLSILYKLKKRFEVDYSFVGDLMPLPAKELRELVGSIEDYDSFVFFGNPLVQLPQEVRERIKEKFSVHFTLFPNLTSQYSTLVVGSANFSERDFIAYRNSFGRVYFCPKAVQKPEGAVVPYMFLGEVLGIEVKVEEFLRVEPGFEGTLLKLPSLEEQSASGRLMEGIVLYTSNGLVDGLGHWNPWTHNMEKHQRAYMSEGTARKLRVKKRLTLRGKEFEVVITPNVAEDVVYVPLSFEEFQPFDPGHSVGGFAKEPYYRFEVLE